MNKSSWVTYQGVDVRVTDFYGMEGEALKQAVLASMIDDQKEYDRLGLPFLSLLDFSRCMIDRDLYTVLKESGENHQRIIKKIAFVGTTKIHQMLLNIALALLRKPVKFCSSRDEALNWLIQRESE